MAGWTQNADGTWSLPSDYQVAPPVDANGNPMNTSNPGGGGSIDPNTVSDPGLQPTNTPGTPDYDPTQPSLHQPIPTGGVPGLPPEPGSPGAVGGDLKNDLVTTQTDPGASGQSDNARIDALLKKYGSTDDPNYWYSLVAQHGGVDKTGADWLENRIMRGDGAAGVRNGTVQRFSDSGSTSGVNPQLASYLTNSPLLNPWTTPFNFTPFQSGPAFQQPTGGLNTDAQGNFVMPNDVTEQNDPGYKFRMQQGQQAIERSAAAKGTLLTGGTLKDLTDYQQGTASQEYGNVYQRALTDWQNNYNSALTNYQTKYNAGLSDWTTNYNAANQQYQQAYNIFSNNQANQYNRIANLAGLGQTAATQLGSQGLGYAGLNSGLITGGGNALAGGTIGSANSYINALGNIGNLYGQNTTLGGIYGNGSSQQPLNSSSYDNQRVSSNV